MFTNVKNYFVSNIFIKALGLISIPITTRFLLPSDFGIVSIFAVYTSIATVILPLNSHASIGRYYFEKNTNFVKFVSTSVWISLFFSILLSILFLIFFIPKYNNEDFKIWVYILIISNAFSNIASSVFIQIHEPANNSSLIAKRSIFTGIVQFVLNLFIVIFSPPPKWEYVIIGMTVTSIIANLYFFKFIKNYIKFIFDLSYIKYILTFSIPLLPYALSGIILSQIDRIMILKNSDSSNTGVYSFAVALSMLVFFVGESINRAWTPQYFKHMDSKSYNAHDIDMINNLKYWTLFAVSFIFLFFEPSKLIIGEKYHSSLDLVPMLIFGYLFEFYFTIYGRNIGYSKKTVYSSIILILSGLINILLNHFTLSKYGFKIASVNTLLSFFSLFLLSYIVNKFILKLHTFSISLLIPSFINILTFVFMFYLLQFFNLNLFLSFFIKTLLLFSFIYFFYLKEVKKLSIKIFSLIVK